MIRQTVLAISSLALAACSAPASQPPPESNPPLLSTPAEVPSSAQQVQPLSVGTQLPSAEVYTASGEGVDLVDVIGSAKTALIFYRGGW